MSAILQALVQDIRTDVLMALDPRVMTKKEATALILLTGVCREGGHSPAKLAAALPWPASDNCTSRMEGHYRSPFSVRNWRLSLVHAAVAWLLLEGIVRVVLGNWLYTLLYPVGAPLHSKGQKQAAKDVTTAGVNLVSIVHVAISVSILTGGRQ